MTTEGTNARRVEVAVDARNPGQVFACMGIFELYDLDAREKGHERPTARFIPKDGSCTFEIEGHLDGADLATLLRSLVVEEARDADKKDKKRPVVIRARDHALGIRLNSWIGFSKRDVAPRLFAGNQAAMETMASLLERKSIRGKPVERWLDSVSFVGFDAFDLTNGNAPLAKNPMGYDVRVGRSTIDVGFSENDVGVKREWFVLVELLAPIGIQFARPARHSAADGLAYALWTEALPLPLARVAMSCALPTEGSQRWLTATVGSQRRGGNPFGTKDEYLTFIPSRLIEDNA